MPFGKSWGTSVVIVVQDGAWLGILMFDLRRDGARPTAGWLLESINSYRSRLGLINLEVRGRVVQGRWEGYQLMEKLRALKGNIKVLNGEVFGDIRIKKKEIIARIDTLELEVPLDMALKGESDNLKWAFADI
ncbi:hypothetical protein E6C27_scaffold270G001500 [Cucumis melo var. makuwa]|uniref:Uncharacterized protein n=1 Tax=Cucumis melo var. makuwa TaxID=1194695 RepID=A0A5A7TAA8_CUCMM|nr:hypothetical protein E6C27_scaffold270G001500 [Cucumis melo var. makuwa]